MKLLQTLKSLKRLSAVFVLLCLCFVAFPADASSPNKPVVINGKLLKHLGSGLRSYFFFDIYNLDAYSESGACAPGDIVYTSETKMIRLTMSRHIPVGHLKWEVRKTFKRNMPRAGNVAALEKKIATFLAFFKKDLPKGAAIEISYVPGKGSTVTLNGKRMGPTIAGRDFPELAWRSYFGGNTCCEKGKKQILEQCRQARLISKK